MYGTGLRYQNIFLYSCFPLFLGFFPIPHVEKCQIHWYATNELRSLLNFNKRCLIVLAVRVGRCSFPVKYLGSIEVQESRGMEVCEAAVKVLKKGKKKALKATLHVSGDGLRVVEKVCD